MRFEWDPAKNAANVAKHGISFEDAARIFDGPVLERIDLRRDYGEVRMSALGLADKSLIYVVYTVREGKHRIISARRANRHERKAYELAYREPN